MDKKEIRERMEAILNKADAEKRSLTEAEEIELDGLEVKAKQMELVEGKTQRSIPLGKSRGDVADPERVKPYGEIGCDYRKLFYGDARVPVTENAEDFCRRALATRTIIAGALSDGGATVPEYWWSDVFREALQQSVALPRVRSFPMQSNELHIPGMDSEDQSAGFFGGVNASWQGEADAATEVSPKVRMVTLKTHKLSMYVSASREVIEDSNSLSSVLTSQMIYGLQQSMDEVLLVGNGVGKPLGVIHSPARVDVGRAVAAQISFADVAGMYARLHPAFVNGAVWVCHPSCLPQLLAMSDAGSNVIWRPAMGMTEGLPNMPLLGLPLLISDKISTLGTRGDLCLINFSAYALGIRQGTVLESTNSAYWSQDLISFRVVARFDGASLLDAPISPRSGATTLSPFVILS